MQDFSVSRCNILFDRVSKLDQLIKIKTPSIGRIRKAYGSEFVILYLTTWIINLNDFLTVKSKMNREQTEETARLIAKEFYNLSIADIHYVFDQAKRGIYGKFYDRLDGAIILCWFREHFEIKCNKIEELNIHEDLKFKESRLNYEESLLSKIRRENDAKR